jgi:hypothetical protein
MLGSEPRTGLKSSSTAFLSSHSRVSAEELKKNASSVTPHRKLAASVQDPAAKAAIAPEKAHGAKHRGAATHAPLAARPNFSAARVPVYVSFRVPSSTPLETRRSVYVVAVLGDRT